MKSVVVNGCSTLVTDHLSPVTFYSKFTTVTLIWGRSETKMQLKTHFFAGTNIAFVPSLSMD